MAIILADRRINVLGRNACSNRKRYERWAKAMKVGDKVYIMEQAAAGVQKGVIVAKKWRFDPMPVAFYVVRKTKDVTSIADVLTTAFYGNTGELDYYPGNALVRVPDISTETTADTNPKNQELGEKQK